MSALGQKQTCAVQPGMSALPLIATAKADSRRRSCLLYPQKRTCAAQQLMSALGQKRTHAVQQLRLLFDPLVGAGKHRRRHRKAERLGGFEIDYQLVLGRSLHRQVGRLLALENALDSAELPGPGGDGRISKDC